MPKNKKTINIEDLPSSFKGKRTINGKYIQSGIPPVAGKYDAVSKTTGINRLGKEFLHNGTNSISSSITDDKLIDNTINYIKESRNKDRVPSNDELGVRFPFNIITTPRTNGKNMPQKQYAAGGKVPNVIEGGIAKPLGNDLYYMAGRKHKNGGIDIGPDDKTGIEVEDGEVVETKNNELKVYSAQPIINGKSPAKLIMGGANPNQVFNAQENFKDRNRIKDDGTKYKYGGDNKPKFEDWYKTVPKELNDTTSYNLRRAYQLLPYNELETWRKKNGHLRSVAPTNDGNYEFLKSKNHPTYKKEIEWYNSSDGDSFRKEYILDESTEYPTYKKRNKTYKMGGLSRDKNYGSKSKPYPKVNKNDFAGGRRSYPIPTKADAVDALRLAGLHRRSDVKTKVYNKYPELRKKAKVGLTVSINGNVKDELLHVPSSTGTARNKYKTGGFRLSKEQLDKATPKYERKLYNDDTKVKTDRTFTYGKFNNNLTTEDYIGLGSNIIGSIGSYISTKKGINNMESPNTPINVNATKLKTNYNINPELDNIREEKQAAYRDIDNNTASSRVGLARKQRVRNLASQTANELYGRKENVETELINRDRLNQQSVAHANAQTHNQYLDRRSVFNNTIAENKLSNTNNLFNGLNASIQDIIGRIEERRNFNNTLSSIQARNPNVDSRILRDAGVKFDKMNYTKKKKRS